jgi:ribosome-binding factor A
MGEAIKEELGDILRNLKDPRIGFVSITRVEVSGDKRVAKVFFSVLGDEAAKKASLKGLESAVGHIRSEVSRRLSVRYTPEIRFALDESIERGVRIAALLNQVGATEAQGKGPEKD